MAGPFRIEGKPYAMAAGQVLASAGREPAKSRITAVIAALGIIAVAAAGLVIYKNKTV